MIEHELRADTSLRGQCRLSLSGFYNNQENMILSAHQMLSSMEKKMAELKPKIETVQKELDQTEDRFKRKNVLTRLKALESIEAEWSTLRQQSLDHRKDASKKKEDFLKMSKGLLEVKTAKKGFVVNFARECPQFEYNCALTSTEIGILEKLLALHPFDGCSKYLDYSKVWHLRK